MALLASQAHVSARQREVAAVVIEGRILPTGWVMAGGAVRAELTAMLVILLMARITIRRRASKKIIAVAVLAGDIRMPAFEFKGREVVIELRRTPAVFVMAVNTTNPKTSFMRIVVAVAGVTIL